MLFNKAMTKPLYLVHKWRFVVTLLEIPLAHFDKWVYAFSSAWGRDTLLRGLTAKYWDVLNAFNNLQPLK